VVTCNTALYASGDTLTSSSIPLLFGTPDETGWCLVYIDAKVYALTNERPDFTTWHIRGGLKNHLIDGGAAANSLGGGIVLGVGRPAGLTINITGP
jgi:hypothetical protein